MEKKSDPELNDSGMGISEINEKLEQKKEEVMASTGMKELFSNLEVDEKISDLFYNSVKLIFETGFNLAKSLNFDYLADSIEKAEEKQKKR